MTTKARGTGEGAIYQRRSDKRWVGVISTGYGPRVRPAEGGAPLTTQTTRKRMSVTGRTRREVELRLRDLRGEQEAGVPHIDRHVTVATYLTGWNERIAPRVRPSTLVRYQGICDRQLTPLLGHIALAKLSPADVARALAQIQASGLSPQTVSHCRSVLRTSLNDAMKWELVVRNAAALADPPRVPRPSPKTMQPSEVGKVLRAVEHSDIANPVALGLWCGARQGELLGLRWQDVDLERHQLTVGASLQRLGGESRLVEPKSEHSRRTLRLSGRAMEALHAEHRHQLEAKIAAGPRWREPISGLVFTDLLGRPLLGTTITKSFQRALRQAGLAPLRFHHLRHLFGSLSLASGVDLATVSHLLGYSSVALTASTYAGVLPSLREDAADRLERLLNGQADSRSRLSRRILATDGYEVTQ